MMKKIPGDPGNSSVSDNLDAAGRQCVGGKIGSTTLRNRSSILGRRIRAGQ